VAAPGFEPPVGDHYFEVRLFGAGEDPIDIQVVGPMTEEEAIHDAKVLGEPLGAVWGMVIGPPDDALGSSPFVAFGILGECP
jgi:hypothetical protein